MTSKEHSRSNEKKLNEVAKQLEKQGYQVYLYPSPNNLPGFLHSYTPDLVAFSNKESVVVEVKSSSTLSTSDYMPTLARVIDQHPGWRYELVLYNPEEEISKEEPSELISLKDIDHIFESSKALLSLHDNYSSYILLWTAIESLLRHLAREQNSLPKEKTASYLVKYLFSLGIIAADDQRAFDSALEKRNQISHGFRPKVIATRTIQQLVKRYETLRIAIK